MTASNRTFQITAPTACALIAALSLSGCSGGGSDDPASPIPDPPAGNSAPTLSGSPSSSTKVGEAWSFTPVATDPDGDTLTFTAENQPTWTSFDESSGGLSGEPQAGDEGSYSDISIIASDGKATGSLTFSITVSQVASGSISLSWVAPTQNNDGSALTDLSAFKIHYGKSSNYSEQILIDNPGVTTYVVENLTPDTYYFVITAINSDGFESDYSGEAVTTAD